MLQRAPVQVIGDHIEYYRIENRRLHERVDRLETMLAAAASHSDAAVAVCWALVRREHPAEVQRLLRVFTGEDE